MGKNMVLQDFVPSIVKGIYCVGLGTWIKGELPSGSSICDSKG